MASRTKGTVPNVRRAMREGQSARADRQTKLNQARAGTVASKLNDSTSRAFRGGKRRNS